MYEHVSAMHYKIKIWNTKRMHMPWGRPIYNIYQKISCRGFYEKNVLERKKCLCEKGCRLRNNFLKTDNETNEIMYKIDSTRAHKTDDNKI